MEDDLLELSSRIVRQFIVRVGRFTLLLAFKLWLVVARWCRPTEDPSGVGQYGDPFKEGLAVTSLGCYIIRLLHH